MKKALFSALCLLVGTCSFEAPASAMSLSEAKREICDAAREYRQYGATHKQGMQEITSYARYLASETGNATNRYQIKEHGVGCFMGF